jgi:phosphotransferase system enzyme I (PtsI)
LKGVPISKGIALARACLFDEARHSRLVTRKVGPEEAGRELARLHEAIEVVGGRLEDIREKVARGIGPAEAEIFAAQKMILEDRELQAQMFKAVQSDHFNAEAAVARVLDIYEIRMREMANEYFRERATDIGEVKRRLLDVLGDVVPSFRCAGETRCQRGRHRIVVARELTPSLTVELQTEDLLGFVTEHGGVTSHAGILARALGIPAVSGLRGVYDAISCGTEILVNGHTGEVVLWPGPETMAEFEKLKGAPLHVPHVVGPVPGFKVMANISLASEVREAQRMKAEGIGLYRTEFEFMTVGRILDEDEQFRRYETVARAMRGRPLYFRLLDIGGDKAVPFLEIPEETNPSLGFRGARLLLGRPELLRPQARAIARASVAGEIHVLYPMIVDLDQFRKLREAFEDAVGDVTGRRLKHGVMFEVPSACLQAREILEAADFGSIGTNDLIQYLFAVDRNNELVAADFTAHRPILWSLIRNIVKAGEETGKPVSLCGEVGSSAEFIARLMDAGVRTVSASIRMIPVARQAAREYLRRKSP